MDNKQVIIIDTGDDKSKLVAQQIIQSKMHQVLIVRDNPDTELMDIINTVDILNEYKTNRAMRRGNKNHKAWESNRYYKK
jgi:MinD-like ATPase involved in chromosome partitioning or flagellar assembly